MRIYYEQTEYEPGKHKIIKMWSSKFLQPMPEENVNEAINIPYLVIELDENWNRDLVKELFTNVRAADFDILLPDKFYIDNAGDIHFTDTDALVPITQNPNKADWALSVLAGATDAQIDTWFSTNVTTLAQARNVMAMMAKLIARLAREVGFE